MSEIYRRTVDPGWCRGDAGYDGGIAQRTRLVHIGADPMERLNNRARFNGTMQPGGVPTTTPLSHAGH